MGKIKVSVEFNCPQGVYNAGGTLQGSVILSLAEHSKITKVTCQVLGWARVDWTPSGRVSDSGSDHYKAEEGYINKMFNLYGTAGGKAMTLSSGAHRFPFQLPLDSSLPSSYEGSFGHVRYLCKVCVGRPLFKFDIHRTVPFTIVRTLDLNTEPGALHPMTAADSVQFNECCCCSTAQVLADFSIDHRAYVSGQHILINGHVTNQSSSKLPPPQAILSQYVTFYGKRGGFFSSGRLKAKTTSGMVIYHSIGDVKSGDTQLWQNQSIEIPPIPPSGLDGCNIIDITYSLVIQINPKDGRPITLTFELTVGTVPVHQAAFDGSTADQSPVSPALDPTAPPAEGLEGPPPYEDMPPPSYEESVFGRVTIYNENNAQEGEDTPDCVNFAPVYPVYHTMRPGTNGVTPATASAPPPTAPLLNSPIELTSPTPPTNPNLSNGVTPQASADTAANTSGAASPESVVLTQPQSSQVIPTPSEKKQPPRDEDWL